MTLDVRPLTDADRDWVRDTLTRTWGSPRIVSRGRVHDADALPGLVAWLGSERAGLLTYAIEDGAMEVVTLDALVRQRGLGTALLAEAERLAREAGCSRLWLVTTNDNVRAQAFYTALGWTHVATHAGAIAAARALKPEIPERGYRNVPIRDDLEYERRLVADAGASAPTAPPRPTVAALLATIASRGIVVPPGHVAVSEFGDSPELARTLIALVRSGTKRATCALGWSYEHDDERLPRVHDLEIVVDHAYEPALLVRVTSVEVVAFGKVTAEFAALEGEGDGSLEHWRHGHRAFFARECERIGRTPSDDMPVVCTTFEWVADVPPASA